MISILTCLTTLEPRLPSKMLWSSDKRKRTDWVCATCSERAASRQRRAYGGDAQADLRLHLKNGEGNEASWFRRAPQRSRMQLGRLARSDPGHARRHFMLCYTLYIANQTFHHRKAAIFAAMTSSQG